MEPRPLDLAPVDVRRELRALPIQRRRAIGRAIREGRAVDDPRDAVLAVAWAQRAQAAPWPRWALPRSRPHGRQAVFWLLHATWVSVVFVFAVTGLISRSHGIVRWIIVGVLVYSILAMPWLFRFTLRMRWNAPEAERRNRELLRTHS